MSPPMSEADRCQWYYTYWTERHLQFANLHQCQVSNFRIFRGRCHPHAITEGPRRPSLNPIL